MGSRRARRCSRGAGRGRRAAHGLYAAEGRRRILPPLVFGLGVLLHLLRPRNRYDVVHTASFPYFSLLAAAVARRPRGFRLVVDWHEVWSREYWSGYLGAVGGRIGHLVQALCLRVPQRAFCFSKMHGARLREGGVRGPVTETIQRAFFAATFGRDLRYRDWLHLVAREPAAIGI